MSNTQRKCRWLQFSIRSVLLLTLAVALWLGYEVRQARQVERTIGALRALGGNAECEATGWSLLRVCRMAGYGRRIVRATVPGAAAEEAIRVLRDLPDDCEVRVAYDGTFDPMPSWQAINDAIRQSKITAVTAEDTIDDWVINETNPSSLTARRLARFRSSVKDRSPDPDDLGRVFQRRIRERPDYRCLLLRDGTLAELLIGGTQGTIGSTEARFAVFLVEGKFVAGKAFWCLNTSAEIQVLLEDLDADGYVDLGFSCQLPFSSQYWLGRYAIESDGLQPTLPEMDPLVLP